MRLEFVIVHPEPPDIAVARALTTEALKALWDSDWDYVSITQPASMETCHRVLNERGEGAYCAV